MSSPKYSRAEDLPSIRMERKVVVSFLATQMLEKLSRNPIPA